MRIQVLCNDKALKGFESEHGLSLYIESYNHHILFDTGSSDVAVKNSEKLRLSLKEIDFVVISHGHYDHIGGLDSILKATGKTRVYAGKGCLLPRYSGPRRAGAPESKMQYQKLGARFEEIDQISAPAKNSFLLPAVPFRTSEMPSARFKRLGIEERVRDFFEDELGLIVIENQNAVLFTGCSHRGIGNIILEATKHWKIKTVVGGLHLLHKSPGEIEEICRLIKPFNIEKFYIGHCTGDQAIETFSKKLQAVVKELKAGQIIEI
ncbi:hypothetical protein AT15_00125 [Kosmotoga arenicorallina S304]|uniref:Metallo-beta-lactamase domain-containing protein n=1 Tax=Kosmotoga arenicorallina S304 TaxID=1453497 RepID=A0A182C8P3_9BACT|nr:MBL fold metallo-hydrolase [Kosmotoga arenicorallina]OAA32519.1 hypothetical protein AT15_00125 [Kosmotoga arenicorallina S304]